MIESEKRNDILVAHSQSAKETHGFGAALAAMLHPGDTVLLTGDLGAGKTQFVQGVASGLGVADAPVSPTFNLVMSYHDGRLPLHHFDLYRLDRPSQLEDIGLREYLEGDGVCFVEWAERFPDAFDQCLRIGIRKGEGSERWFWASAEGERSAELLASWKAVLDGVSSGAVSSGATPVGGPQVIEAAPAGGSGDAEGAPIGGPGALKTTPIEEPRTIKTASIGKSRNPAAPAAEGLHDIQKQGGHDTQRREGAATPKDAAPSCAWAGEPLVLAFDTANEAVAVALGVLDADRRAVTPFVVRQIAAHRASNTTLLPAIDELMTQIKAPRSALACIAVGRGPGSFTGVRIAVATAKGIAQALRLPLLGLSTLDAVAWRSWDAGVRGDVLVVADAMRKEVYPVRFRLDETGVSRLEADSVVKAQLCAQSIGSSSTLQVIGDGLVKYHDLFAPVATVLSDKLWEPTGEGLLLALQAAWQAGEVDPYDPARHQPQLVLPVYTRLSDAEENERARASCAAERNLATGVQDLEDTSPTDRRTLHELSAQMPDRHSAAVTYRPLGAADIAQVAALEAAVMGSDAWSEAAFSGELGQRGRLWWVAWHGSELVGYAGALVVDGEAQILKVAVAPPWRRQGIAERLFALVADDARNLGASRCVLEVRASNDGAQAFYGALGLASSGTRPRYYSDGEDAALMAGLLPRFTHGVGGMELQHHETPASEPALVQAVGEAPASPLILAIESSCDETAAALVDGDGRLHSDVVASQIDFHSRFGGVVPEIASRKHIEAIGAVCDEALGAASWSDLDALAVTAAPGLLGGLVVGVAFAKGAAWALDLPLITVNHLEGHLYANKIGNPDFQPPAVASVVSGGNTLLVFMRSWGDYTVLGQTIDDAVGEAFDKVAKALGLGYPGGPVVSAYAAQGDPNAIPFPRAMLHSHDYRFSLSGLKTAVVNHIQGLRESGRELPLADICASFQQAVIDVQVAKAETALRETGAPTFCLGGGVAANPALRQAYQALCDRLGVQLVMPPLASCGDNAAMIALVALDRFKDHRFAGLDADAQAHSALDEPY